MSTASPHHAAASCPCEECLTARIRATAAQAAGRDLSALRARLDGARDVSGVRSTSLRSAS